MKIVFKIISIILTLATAWLLLVLLSLFIYPKLFELFVVGFLNNIYLFPFIPFLNLIAWWLSGKWEIGANWEKLHKVLGVVSLIIFACELVILYLSTNNVRY